MRPHLETFSWMPFAQAAGPDEAIESVPWGALTPIGLLLFAVLLVLTGRLVPRSSLDDERRRGDQWREQAMKRDEQTESQFEIVRENTRAVNRLADRVDLPTQMVQSLRGEQPGNPHQEEQ